jgi:hypothetical protein
MTLPSSGSLSYNTIRAEFGSPSTNVYLSLYYRGGPYTYALPQNNNITTSSTGTISVSNFYGASNKGPFMQFSGGTYNSGGKAPIVYYGAGGPSLPSVADSSLTIGGTGYSVSKFYAIGGSMFISGTPSANVTSAPTWSQRNFYAYNSSGSLAFHFRTGWAAGRGQMLIGIGTTTNQTPRTNSPVAPAWMYESNGVYPSGSLGLYTDYFLSTAGNSSPPSPQPVPSFVTGSAATLAQYLVVKAN